MADRRGRRLDRGRLLALAPLLAVLGGLCAGGQATATNRGGGPPNLLLVVVDDQATNSFKHAYMPRTFEGVVDAGTRFPNGLAAPPLCCPDRAGLLTGQYPHNHGVFSNEPGYGALEDPSNTLPVWLDRAGYRTAAFGKFINGYGRVAGAEPAPGIDRWLVFPGASRYYGYRLSVNGEVRSFGHSRREYSTDVLTRRAAGFIRGAAKAGAPFFAWVGYNAPHVAPSPRAPCPRRAPTPPDRASLRAVRGVPLPKPPSFNEADVSDKPPSVAARARLDAGDRAEIRTRWHCTLAAMAEVDRGVGRLVGALRRSGELRSTIIAYASDNGYYFGEHRQTFGKSWPYDPALRVPYALRVPGAYRDGPARAVSKKVVSNQDITATFMDLARRRLPALEPCEASADCRRMDGRSLAPLLAGAGSWPADRGSLAELDMGERGCECRYAAIRTRHYLYVEYTTGDRELYDLEVDPDELENLAGDPGQGAIRAALAARLDALRDCSGVEGRDPPSGDPYCE